MLLPACDGTDFHSRLRQRDVREVQDVVEQAVRKAVRHQRTLLGSGRTGAGAHAHKQRGPRP